MLFAFNGKQPVSVRLLSSLPVPLARVFPTFLFIQIMDQVDPPLRQRFVGEIIVRDAKHRTDATDELRRLPHVTSPCVAFESPTEACDGSSVTFRTILGEAPAYGFAVASLEHHSAPRTRGAIVGLAPSPWPILTAQNKWHPDSERTGCHYPLALGGWTRGECPWADRITACGPNGFMTRLALLRITRRRYRMHCVASWSTALLSLELRSLIGVQVKTHGGMKPCRKH